MNSIACGSCNLNESKQGSAKRSQGKPPDVYDYVVAGTIPAVIGSRLTLNFTTQSDSYFVVQKLESIQAGIFTLQAQETGAGVLLSDDFIRNVNLFGTAQRPAILLDPFVIAPSSNIIINLINGIAGANAIELTFTGYKHYDLKNPPSLRSLPYSPRPLTGTVKWFQYSVTQALAANEQKTVQTKIQSDSNFILRKLIADSTGNFRARFADTASGQQWSSNYLQAANYFGTAQRPNILHKSRVVLRNSSIQTDIQDLSGVANNVQIVFEGAKHYV